MLQPTSPMLQSTGAGPVPQQASLEPSASPADAAQPAAGTLAQGELLDLSVLTQLTRRNPKMMREIASVFLAFMDRTMNELDAAMLAGDRTKLSALGHKAKSSAGAVGAMGLSSLCQQLEVSMKDPAQGLDHAHRLVAEIRAQMGPIGEKLASVLS
jgi:HPt (histidine-containing phosphotransfer) domain-containing protein